MSLADHEPRFAAVFDSFPDVIRTRLLALRRLIFETAASTEGVGQIAETLKWGEPAYLTSQTNSGSTIRLGWKPDRPDEYALYFTCSTDLVSTFAERFPDELRYVGNRAIVLHRDEEIAMDALRSCIRLALTYHWKEGRPSLPEAEAAEATGGDSSDFVARAPGSPSPRALAPSTRGPRERHDRRSSPPAPVAATVPLADAGVVCSRHPLSRSPGPGAGPLPI